jgi:hypothetical protein
MQIHTVESPSHQRTPGWSNRFLIAAIVGILFLTLFPFRFDFQSRLPGNSSPFLLGSGIKTSGFFDAFLNVLLFVPFGFGLAEKLRERKLSRLATLLVVWVAGAVFSYAIELTQIYIPMRDSGWEDVLTNSTGAVVGSFLFEILGGFTIALLSRAESACRSWLTIKRIAVLLPIYFVSWFAFSAALQTKTKLSNWDPDCLLVVGNDAAGQSPWKGQIQELEIADRAVPNATAFELTSGQASAEPLPDWRAEYHFAGAPPFKDTKEFLPTLSWAPPAPASAPSDALVLNGQSWLASNVTVADLVADLQKTNQFALHLICAAEATHDGRGHIISISRPPSFVDLTVRQEESALVLWFRNPLSVKRAILAWYVPNVFTDTKTRNILYSYDGANLSLYINGKKSGRPYRLGPGTALARLLRKVRPAELQGYMDIYYLLVFFPVGIILGMAAQAQPQPRLLSLWGIVLYFILPAFLLEFILVRISGRAFSTSTLLLSLSLIVAGFLWIRSDSASFGAAPAPQRQASP